MSEERRNGNREFMQVLNEISISHAACSARVSEQIKSLVEKIDTQHEEIKAIISRQDALNGKHHAIDIKVTKLTLLGGVIGGAISLMGRFLLNHLIK
jgi:hypothetical protein